MKLTSSAMNSGDTSQSYKLYFISFLIFSLLVIASCPEGWRSISNPSSELSVKDQNINEHNLSPSNENDMNLNQVKDGSTYSSYIRDIWNSITTRQSNPSASTSIEQRNDCSKNIKCSSGGGCDDKTTAPGNAKATGTAASALCVDGTQWTGTRVLAKEAGYAIHWKIIEESSVDDENIMDNSSKKYLLLRMEMNAINRGWMGFGFGEKSSGSMLGADVVTVHIDKQSKKPVVTDRYVPFDAFPMSPYPQIDDSQDWEMVSYSIGLFKWSAILKRKLNTNDSQDRVLIENELMRIIWAWDTKSESVEYHAGNRHAGTININVNEIPRPTPPKDATDQIHVRHDAYKIPTDDVTHYACKGFDLTDKDRHVVMIEPYIQPGNEKYVHHFLVHACENTYPYNPIHPAGAPTSLCIHTSHGLSPLGFQGCKTLMYAWAVGGSSFVLPEDTGFRLGGDGQLINGFRYLILEVHYNNPDLKEDIVDSSGVILHVTKDASTRKQDATILIVGDTQISLAELESGKRNHREVTCLSSCTKRFAGPLKVFASFLHMHSYGQQAYTMRYPGGDLSKGVVGNHISFWSFDFQQITEIFYDINPGDQLSLHGIYDLTKAEEDVQFGLESTEEMLFDFLFVYPKSNLNELYLCGRQFPDVSVCGPSAENDKVYRNISNPIPDGRTTYSDAFGTPSKNSNKQQNIQERKTNKAKYHPLIRKEDQSP